LHHCRAARSPRLGLVDVAFEHDLGVGRYLEIDRGALGELDRPAAQKAGEHELVDPRRQRRGVVGGEVKDGQSGCAGAKPNADAGERQRGRLTPDREHEIRRNVLRMLHGPRVEHGRRRLAVRVEGTQQRERGDLGVVEHVVHVDRGGMHGNAREMIAREVAERMSLQR